jgi:exoribonuclease R
MTRLRLQSHPVDDAEFAAGLQAIAQQMDLPAGFPAEVEEEAARAAASPRLPALDRTDIAFATIDPPGAMDLDQALHIERDGDGYTVHYAIADVAAFVAPGGAIDREAHARGQTLYGAGAKVPLHPKALSEGAASLLPGQLRPALLWTHRLDAAGELVASDVRRARVRSRARFDYAGVQATLDAGTADAPWLLLREVGEKRRVLEATRGGVSLGLPSQEVEREDGRWRLAYRDLAPVEGWNAQVSLLTGMAAAQMMIAGGVGLLRTLPPPFAEHVTRLHLAAQGLGIDWPPDVPYPAFVRGLDPRQPRHVAMMTTATLLLRGSGYVAFADGAPAQAVHAAIAAPYAHVTAPLRRLADRYAGEACVALCAHEPVPAWVLEALPSLPDTMRDSDRRANRYERAIVDLVEALVLAPRLGETFVGTLTSRTPADARVGTVMLRELAIEARVTGASPLPVGADLPVRLVQADPVRRLVAFELA